MDWVAKHSRDSTISETVRKIVEKNTGMTATEFLTPYTEENPLFAEAAGIVLDAILSGKPICIAGDYDCDGICAAAIMALAIKAMGQEDVTVRLPKRMSEGFGLSETIAKEFPDNSLVITVDNGITSVSAIKSLKERGCTVLLTDHHLPDGDIVPEADLIVDTSILPDCKTKFCGAGIAMKIAIEIVGKENKLVPVLMSLAAIATIADVVPLKYENRKICIEGFRYLEKDACRTGGIASLLSVLNTERVTEKEIGFKIAPCINAAGRMKDDGAMEAYSVVSATSPRNLSAHQLAELNEARKTLKNEQLSLVEQYIKNNVLFGNSVFCIYIPELAEGLIGIYAGQISEKYDVPCFVFTDSNDGWIKASGRSIPSVNLKETLDQLDIPDMKYGGHAGAAGLSIRKELFEEFEVQINNLVPHEEISEKYYDIDVAPTEIPELYSELSKYAPFGEGNPEITIRIKSCLAVAATYMGSEKNHVKLSCKDFTVICFDMAKLYKAYESVSFDIVGTLGSNVFRGKETLQVEAISLFPSKKARTALASLIK